MVAISLLLGLLGPKATYYVSTNGNDAWEGTEGRPWRTIQKAADVLVAGESVFIKAGRYNEAVTAKNSGVKGKPIRYAAYPGHEVTIDGEGLVLSTDFGGVFKIAGKEYITVSGIKVINAGPHENNAGFMVVSSSNILLENNSTYNTASSGIGVWYSDSVVLHNNDVSLCCNDGKQECITVAATHNFKVYENHVHHSGASTNGGEGIDVKQGSANGKVIKNHVHDLVRTGIYVDAWNMHTFGIEVSQNNIHDCAHGIGVASEAGGLLEDVSIENNLVYMNKNNGIAVGWLALAGPVEDVHIVNNTVVENGNAIWNGGITVMNPFAKEIVIRNNIVSNNFDFQVAVESFSSNVRVDYNLIDGFRGYFKEVTGDNEIEQSPLFVNDTAADYRLQADSPARDAGNSMEAPVVDYLGTSRPQGSGVDVGAYEFVN